MPRTGWITALAVIVADQALKAWIVGTVMAPPSVIALTPFLNIVMVWNKGVSFGMLGGVGDYLAIPLALFALVVAVLLISWMVRARRPYISLLLGLIIGGAVGNAIDRLRFGAVADFIDLHYAGWHWPAFNVADAAITIGVVLLLADSLLGRKR